MTGSGSTFCELLRDVSRMWGGRTKDFELFADASSPIAICKLNQDAVNKHPEIVHDPRPCLGSEVDSCCSISIMLHFLYPEHIFLLLSLRAEFQGSNVQEIKEEHVHVLHRVLQWSIPGLFVRPTEMTWEVVPLVGFRIDVQCSVELTSSFAAWNQHTATDRAVKCRSAGGM